MFGVTHYWIFTATCIMLNLTPGADTFFVLNRSVSRGVQAGIYAAFGIGAGSIIQSLYTGLGLAFILAESPMIFHGIKLAGAAYLVYLGIRQLRERETDLSALDSVTRGSKGTYFFQALFTNVSNPEVTVFFLTFLPQFIEADSGWGVIPFFLLGGTLAFTGTVYSILLAVFAGRITARLRAGHRGMLRMNRVTGILFIALGILSALA